MLELRRVTRLYSGIAGGHGCSTKLLAPHLVALLLVLRSVLPIAPAR